MVQSEVAGNMIFQLNLSGNAFIDTLRALKTIFGSFLGDFNQARIEEYYCKVRTGTQIAQELWGRSWFRRHGGMLLIVLHLMDTQSGFLKNPGPSTLWWPCPQWAEPSHNNHYLRKDSKMFACMFMQEFFFQSRLPPPWWLLCLTDTKLARTVPAHHACIMSKKILVGYSHNFVSLLY